MLKTLLNSLRELVQWLIALRRVERANRKLGQEAEKAARAQRELERERKIRDVEKQPTPRGATLRALMRARRLRAEREAARAGLPRSDD